MCYVNFLVDGTGKEIRIDESDFGLVHGFVGVFFDLQRCC